MQGAMFSAEYWVLGVIVKQCRCIALQKNHSLLAIRHRFNCRRR